MIDLRALLSGIGRPKILVLGDVMLDRYTLGDAERVSPEAPVIVLAADQDEVRPGGAASVAYLLKHLDAEVTVAGVMGNDTDGHTLRALLQDEGIDHELVLIDPTRSTTSKHRFVGRASDRHPHQILRVDRESRVPISESLVREMWWGLEQRLADFDAILISDYLKGCCTEHLLHEVIQVARANGQPVLVDPGKVADYRRYSGATVLKPNRIEAGLAVGRALGSVEETLQAAESLRQRGDFHATLITLDREGLVVATADSQHVIESEPRAVYDITGAGDMVLATLGLCIASGISVPDAARIANVAAGLEVERFGITPIERSELMEKLALSRKPIGGKVVTTGDAVALASEYRRQGKRIVFSNGCFDLLHVGHVTCLEQAAMHGNVLFVAVNSDASVRRLKGQARPIISEHNRARMLASLTCVSHVIVFDEDTPHRLLESIRPDVLAKGGTTSDISGREIVTAYGGHVVRVSEEPGISTTNILAQLKAD